MGRTPEQCAADAQMAAAVDAACRAYGMPITHGYTLVEFIAIAEWVRYNDGGEGDASYDEFHGVVYQDGATRSSVAIGLCRIAEQLIGEGAVTTSGGQADVDPGFD